MKDSGRQSSPHYSYIYQMGVLGGYGGYLSRRSIDKDPLEVFFITAITILIIIGLLYLGRFYLSKKNFQVPKLIKLIEGIEIAFALLYPLSIFVNNKHIILLLFLPLILKGVVDSSDKLEGIKPKWQDFVFLAAFATSSAIIASTDIMSLSEKPLRPVVGLIVYYTTVFLYFIKNIE